MTKKQKIWMWIFIAMFVIPEILWSPTANFMFSFINPPINGNYQIFRNNFLFDYKYEGLLKLVILIQVIGIVAFLVFWYRNKDSVKSRLVFWVVLFISLIISLVSLFVFYFMFIFNVNLFM